MSSHARVRVLPLTDEGPVRLPAVQPAGGNSMLLELELLRGRLLTCGGLAGEEREALLADVDRVRGRIIGAMAPAPSAPAPSAPDAALPLPRAGAGVAAPLGDPNIVGNHPAVRRVLARAMAIARTPYNVLITGETGTGKEVLARIIHEESGRRVFLPVNCGAIPQPLIESELFGHVKGAFTGATRDRPGKFEVADGGTIFLDEIGEFDGAMQVRLLRAVQSGEVQRVGSDRVYRVDVRVIAATNRTLGPGAPGTLREDLFYRLAVCHLHLPPLRQRRDEIPALLTLFLGRAAHELNRRVPPLATELEDHLLYGCDYPGNIRQLENVARLIVALTPPGRTATFDVLPEDLLEAGGAQGPDSGGVARAGTAAGAGSALRQQVARVQRDNLVVALRRARGCVNTVAAELGLSTSRVYQLCRKFGLQPGGFRSRSAP
jgi:transcriptional regulator with GAF, ATPase, and Fis domain